MISHFFIDRPIFASVCSIVFVLAGGVAVFTLPVAQYPEVTPPTVLVTALYPGANADTVRDTVAAPIEEQVNGVEGMMYMSSQSINDGTYRLSVTFKLGMDSDMAQVLVQNRVSLALPVIPALVQNEGINVKKLSPNTLMIVNLISPDNRYDATYLSNYATIYIRDEFSRLPGVADIGYLGQRDYSLRAWIDPNKLATLGLTAADVVAAIAQQNLQVAAGQIGQEPVPKGQQFQLTINTLGRLVDPGGVRRHHHQGRIHGADLVVRHSSQGGSGADSDRAARPAPPAVRRPGPRPLPRPTGIVRLRDVARVVLGSQQYEQSCTLNGQPERGPHGLPASRLQCPGDRRAGLRQDGGAQDPLPAGHRLPDRLRHYALHPRVGRRRLLHAPRRDRPGGPGGAGLPAELAGGPDPPGRRAGGHRRHFRLHGRAGLSRSITSRSSAWCWRSASSWTTPSWWSRTSSAGWNKASRPARRRTRPWTK